MKKNTSHSSPDATSYSTHNRVSQPRSDTQLVSLLARHVRREDVSRKTSRKRFHPAGVTNACGKKGKQVGTASREIFSFLFVQGRGGRVSEDCVSDFQLCGRVLHVSLFCFWFDSDFFLF